MNYHCERKKLQLKCEGLKCDLYKCNLLKYALFVNLYYSLHFQVVSADCPQGTTGPPYW